MKNKVIIIQIVQKQQKEIIENNENIVILMSKYGQFQQLVLQYMRVENFNEFIE